MSPDWSAKEEPVPYAQLDDPQSLDLYAYVQNNPLSRVDADGHDILGEIISYIAVHVASTGVGIMSARRDYNVRVQQAASEGARDAAKPRREVPHWVGHWQNKCAMILRV
jgi:hypothetical protein